MKYVSPNITSLLADDEQLKKLLSDHKERNQSIQTLLTVNALIRTIFIEKPALLEDLHDILLGLRLFYLKNIADTYFIRNPYKCDPLYQFLTNELQLNTNNEMSPQNQMIYLEKSYNFIFKNNLNLKLKHKTPYEVLADLEIDLPSIRLQFLKVMRIVLAHILKDVKCLIHAPAPEFALDEDLKGYYSKYKAKKTGSTLSIWGNQKLDNEKRIIHSQIGESIGVLCHKSKPAENNDYLTRSERKKLGMVLYFMNSIYQEYFLRSATNSHFYKQNRETLRADLHDLDLNSQIGYMVAFKHLLQDDKLLEEIEEYGRNHFKHENALKNIDLRVAEITQDLDKIILNLFNKTKCISNPITKNFKDVLKIILFAPLFAFGQQAGRLVSQSNITLDMRIQAGQGVRYVTAYLGMSGGYLGFLAADFWLQSTLERLFGKMFEFMGLLIATTSLGTIGLVVDLSYKGLQALCKATLKLHSELNDPKLISSEDLKLIRCIANLPKELVKTQMENEEQLAVEKILRERERNKPTPKFA